MQQNPAAKNKKFTMSDIRTKITRQEKNQKNMAYKQEKYQSTETNPKTTELMEFAKTL